MTTMAPCSALNILSLLRGTLLLCPDQLPGIKPKHQLCCRPRGSVSCKGSNAQLAERGTCSLNLAHIPAYQALGMVP